MEKLGVTVSAKCCLVTRIDLNGQMSDIANISTGNYHANTNKYSDISIFTADVDICTDAAALFSMFSGSVPAPAYRRLIVSPHSMNEQLIGKIMREAEVSGTQGRIIMTDELTHRSGHHQCFVCCFGKRSSD